MGQGALATIVGRRVLSGVVTILILMVAVFFAIRLIGDPVDALAGATATAEDIAAIERSLGLDRPLPQQFVDYLAGVVQGDMGTSYRTGQSALTMVLDRLPATLSLTFLALGTGALIAIPVGVVAAVKPGSIFDGASRVLAVLGQSMPVFWLGIVLIMIFAVNLGFLPSGGRGTWQHLVLPVAAMAAYSLPLTMRLTRSTMLEVLNQDYIRTARSKGLPRWKVMFRHALRNALIPIITVLALRLGHVISGVIVLEEVFAYPGVGRLAIQSVLNRDFPVFQVFILVMASFVVLINMVADILYTMVDPRVRVD